MDFPFAGDGQQSVSSAAVTLSVAGAANLKGAWAEFISALPINARSIFVQSRINTTNRRILTDIGIGASGAEIPIINNIFTAMSGSQTAQGFYFPIEIPQGTRISGRMATNNTTITRAFTVTLFSAGFLPSVGYNRVITLGADTSASTGTTVTPGGSNLKGNWTQITAGVDRDIRELWMTINHPGGDFTVESTALYFVDIGMGPASAERIIVPNLQFTFTANGDQNISHTSFWYPVHIPANTRIAVRAQTSIASPENFVTVLYGV